MRINLKVRMKNKVFLLVAAALIIALVYQILAMFGVMPSVSQNGIVETVAMLLNILAFFGVIVDPTTEGMSDSERALTYLKANDVRTLEKMNITVNDFSAEGLTARKDE